MKSYTDEQLLTAVKNNSSVAAVLRELGLKPAGGNYTHLRKQLERLGVDTSHWHLNRGWSKGKHLKHHSKYKHVANLKKFIITSRGHVCEDCTLTDWMGQPIPLELHHEDGDRSNNSDENLKLLCPNCHSFTETWRKAKTRNENVTKAKYYCACGREMSIKSTTCEHCFNNNRTTKIDWPDVETLIAELNIKPYTVLAKELGVSDSAIRRRLKNQGIDPKTRLCYSK